MPEPISKVQRWLDLIAYLVGRRYPVPVEELMERLPAYARDWVDGDDTSRKSVRRKFERDKAELRDLGIPLETVTYSINYGAEQAEAYRISGKNFYLPYLRLLREEGTAREPLLSETSDFFRVAPDGSIEVREEVAFQALRGLRELADLPAFPLAPAARGALRKLTFDLDLFSDVAGEEEAPGEEPDAGVRRRAGAGRRAHAPSRILFAVPPETVRAQEHLKTLSDALLRRKKVTFTYHGIHRNEATRREVRPYGLLFQHSHWYLVGWDEGREGERIFRVDRMEDVEANRSSPGTPDFEMPAEPVLERYRQRQAWELGEAEESLEALVRFRFPASLWAERNRFGQPVGEAEDGSSLRRFEVRQPNPFLRWVLSLEGDARIESPPELRKAFDEMARQVAELYREEPRA